MAGSALVTQPAFTVAGMTDAHVQRLGALILSTLDRLGLDAQQVSRSVVYGRRVIVVDLPFLDYDTASKLIDGRHFGDRLTRLVTPRLVMLRRRSQGCAIIIDLQRR